MAAADGLSHTGSSAQFHADPTAMRATQLTRFKVFSRVRPFIESELLDPSGDLRSIVEMSGSRTILLDPKEAYEPKAQFEFDDSLWSIRPEHKVTRVYHDAAKPFMSQRAVYELVARGCASDALQGFNTAIMTYGQTGSGKTYTMMGQYDPLDVCGEDGQEGIIPRVCHEVFTTVEAARQAQSHLPETQRSEIVVEVTFVEIYMEKVRDLLDPSLRGGRGGAQADLAAGKPMKEARIRLDPESGPFIEDVTKYRVANWAHCCTLLERGSAQRTTSANNVHTQSSRSHAIFQITLLAQQTIAAKDKFSRPTTKTLAGRISLVDLAGSERGGLTDYVKESSKINQSLLALRRVIDCLVERQNQVLQSMSAELQGQAMVDRNPPQVPFRDSVLTWLLSDSIGGNARTTMIAALSPHAKNYGDTLATLQWSSRARNLVTVVKVNTTKDTALGMQSKASDIHASLSSQRASVDAIRGELDAKQALIERFEAENLSLMRRTIVVSKETSEFSALNAALTLQRVVRERQWRKAMALKQKRLEDVLEDLQSERSTFASLSARKGGLAQQRDDAAAILRTEEEETSVVRSRVAEIQADEARFTKQFDEAAAVKSQGEGIVDETKVKYAAEEAELDAVVVDLRAAHERSAGSVVTAKAQLVEYQEFLGKNDDAAEAARQAKLADARKASSESDSRLAELRRQKAELTAKRDALKKQLEEKQAKSKKK